MVIATGCGFAILFAMDWAFFKGQRRIEDRYKASPYPLPPGGTNRPPPQPRLEQVNRMEEHGESYRLKLLQMEQQLHSSGRRPRTELSVFPLSKR